MKKILSIIFLLAALTSDAQSDGFYYADDLTVPVDTFVHRNSRLLNILREFRFQAYLQPEWQKTDTLNPAGNVNVPNIGFASGGNFPQYANNRFLLRRGRFKFSFEHKNAKDLKIVEFAFQFDASEKGFTVKDFYGRIIDPWIGWFSLQGGIFLRPFGYETPAAPAFHESPEFSRVNITVFPNEVELGEALVIESPAKFEALYLRVDANIVNGQGIGVGFQTGTYQSRKDFIGRIKVGKMWNVGKSKLGFNASVSYYNGGVLQSDNTVYQLKKDSTGAWYYSGYTNDTLKYVKVFKREYYGAHLELKADYPLGTTTIRGEFIAGVQPGKVSSSGVPTGILNGPPPEEPVVIRKFNGAMFYLTQSFKNRLKTHTMMHDITVKFDWYNPQSQVKGSDKTNLRNFTSTDIKYTTLGFGYSFIPYNWFKLMVWYDYILNESTGLSGWTGDYKKDNVLTIRTQFYFDTWWFNQKSKYKDNLMLKKY